MALPVATRKSAFIAGASFSVLICLLAVLHAQGVIPFDPEGPVLFPLILAYFFISSLILVIDVRSIAPKQLKTRIPGAYLPTSREGLSFMISHLLSVWARMLLWALGAGSVGLPLALVMHAIAR
jgi:hypothetical protein